MLLKFRSLLQFASSSTSTSTSFTIHHRSLFNNTANRRNKINSSKILSSKNPIKSTTISSFCRRMVSTDNIGITINGSNSGISQHVIELRSDTFTKPSEKMLQAMVTSPIGDSSYEEDPTTNELERRCAELFGKEASLFVPSGTMSNLIAVLVHCDRRDAEVIVGDKSHIHIWEQGGVSQIGGVYSKQIETLPDGTYDLEKLEKIISTDLTDRWAPITQLVCLENTHNINGGRAIGVDYLNRLHDVCKKHNAKLHLDGSRVMNAALALNVDVKELVKQFDSVNFCFSKGVGAPFGSILAGSKDFITKAIRVRQSLGGGLRQSGIMAAACLVGLDNMLTNIKEDNENAKRLATGIREINDLKVARVEVETTETNIVVLTVVDDRYESQTIVERLKQVKSDAETESLGGSPILVKCGTLDRKRIRFVTHCNVTQEQIDLAIRKINYVMKELSIP